MKIIQRAEQSRTRRKNRLGIPLRDSCAALASLLLLAILVPPAVRAQVDTGSIQGQVTDSTGAAIPDSLVTLLNENTGVIASLHADARGNFSFSPVRVGVYTLSTERHGFQRQVRQHIRLDIQ